VAQKKAHEVDRFIADPDSSFPLVLLYGPDRGLVSERAASFAKATGVALEDPFSTIRLEAAEIDADPARLGDEARTLSLFGGKRLIWLRGAISQKGVVEAVKWLIAAPPQQTIVLIEAGDLKKTAPLRSVIETASCAMALPCYSDDGRATDALITRILAEFNMKITREARQILRAHLGENRLVSRAELEKLCLYTMGKAEIGVEDVEASVSNVSINSQDHIIDALIMGDVVNFNERFDRQCEAGIPLFLVVSAAQRQFQQLQQLRDLMEREGKSAASVVATARPPIFFQRRQRVEAALDLWPMVPLKRACVRLQDCVLESRKFTDLAETLIRQHLLALTLEAARLARLN